VRIALDTNVLAYAEGLDDAERRDSVLDLLARVPQESIVVPDQVLGELFNVLTRRSGRSREDARNAILSWRDAFAAIETSPEIMLAAADLAADHRLGIWDAVTLSAASKAGCRLLLSEDMADGFTWGGVSVANPFAPKRHDLLEALLETGSA
jgi:predicted nucleic acid-binding protein